MQSHATGSFLPRARRVKPVLAFDPPLPAVTRGGDELHIAYVEPAVRAQGTTSLRPVWLVIQEPQTDALAVRWEATATNADKRVVGSFVVALRPPAASVERLLADLPGED